MKKIMAIALAVAGVVWVKKRSNNTPSEDVWAEATDKV